MADSPETTRIRIKVLVNSDGEYAAYGFDGADVGVLDEVLDDMMSEKDSASAREFWVTADIPMPQPIEIAASTVEACNDGE